MGDNEGGFAGLRFAREGRVETQRRSSCRVAAGQSSMKIFPLNKGAARSDSDAVAAPRGCLSLLDRNDAVARGE